MPAAFNAANEEAVDAFRRGHLRFTGISDLLSGILDEADHVRSNPRDVHDVWATEDWARARAREIIASMATGWRPANAGLDSVGGGVELDVDRHRHRAVCARAAVLHRLA